MKVQIEKTFAIPAAAETAWVLLQDIERVAGCMPGARITERSDAQNYKGTVAVKFGPASMSFRGDVEVVELQHASRTLRLVGKGTDSTGSSAASMDLTARLEALDAASCNLVGASEVSMSGKAATFGGRMMGAVADQVLKQFAANFASQAQALQVQAVPAQAVPEEWVRAPEGSQPPAVSDTTGPVTASAAAAALPPLAAALSPAAARAPDTPAPPQLDGLALAWAIFKDWLRSLIAAKKA
jgi:hypothetical protein